MIRRFSMLSKAAVMSSLSTSERTCLMIALTEALPGSTGPVPVARDGKADAVPLDLSFFLAVLLCLEAAIPAVFLFSARGCL